jgi:hypothetical protein
MSNNVSLVGLERNITNLEFNLSVAGIIPVLGAIPGITKVAFGIVQTLGALLVMILSLPFCWSESGRAVTRRAVSHIVNGVGNIVAGALESIPIVGTVIVLIRIRSVVKAEEPQAISITGQEQSFVGYAALEKNPERFRKLNNTQNNENSWSNLPPFSHVSPWIVV